MKKSVVGILIAVLALPVQAQNAATKPVIANYDLDSTSDISCVVAPIQVTARVVTSGSSTTVSALTTGTEPFISASVGDVVSLRIVNSAIVSGDLANRVITAKASSDSITVDTAIDLGTVGSGLTIWKRTCAASSASHWIATSGNKVTTVNIQLNQISVASGGVGFKIEGVYGNAADSFNTANNIWPGDSAGAAQCNGGTYASGYCVFTAAGSITFTTANVIFPSAIRLKMKLTGTDDGSDTGADAEKVVVYLTEVK